MEDLVSIIMPSYNTGAYIAKTIESVLSQTYGNWELIIADDCSTDHTDEIVSQYLSDNRIQYIKKKYNSGAGECRNICLKAARGKWIAFLDSDDLWKPEKLTEQIKFMRDNDYHFSYTEYAEINETGDLLGTTVSGPQKISRNGFFNYCWPGCLTVMYDRELIGLIQIKNIKKNNDYAMWLEVSKKANCYLLKKDLAFYRRGRKGSISTSSIKTLIGWHYRLYRESENQSVLVSAFNTARNLVFGFYKKMWYQKQEATN
jgi:glycosyltransferase involved in cell wall biosynthesis